MLKSSTNQQMSNIILCLLLLFCAWGVAYVRGGGGCDLCPSSAPFNDVTISFMDDYRQVISTTCPPYESQWFTPGTACEVTKTYDIPLYPKFARVPIPVGEVDSIFEDISYLKIEPAPIFGSLGILKNGVNIYGVGSPCGFSVKCENEGAPTDYVDAVEAEGHTVDECGGHPTPNGEYHIHYGNNISSNNQRERCDLPIDTAGEHSELLGWMFDGFGIYGRYSQGGLVPTDLDECHGHTHEIDDVETYHYHFPETFPWTIGCFKGCPKVSNSRVQLAFAESDPTYGCPEGLDEDPDPVIEEPPTTSTTIAGASIVEVPSLAILGLLIAVVSGTIL